jgi:solute carrier family 25 (mitochondrial thiamine pyrophosphate transporter), member 19
MVEVEQLRDEGTRLQVLAAASTAGLVSRFVIAPLDVIKVSRARVVVRGRPV